MATSEASFKLDPGSVLAYCCNVSRDVLKRPDGGALKNFHGIYSQSPQMEKVFRLIERVARTDCTVLIRGESGSGKELVARAIHDLSARASRPFRAINCATLSPTLLQSELVGHRRGAFTGAVSDHDGLFKQADTGTLFLDEVAEMPLDIQAHLLRVLEDQSFIPLGGALPVKVDVRLLSASNKALRREVEEGRFRDDLRYRIRVVPLFLPALRDRSGDVEALLWHFIDEFNREAVRRVERLSAAARDAILAYEWPGNVRELRNVVQHAFVIGDGPVLDLADLTPELRGEAPPGVAPVASLGAAERRRIVAALEASNGRKAVAAKALGMSRSTLWRKIREHGLR